jgi:peroxiredoxin
LTIELKRNIPVDRGDLPLAPDFELVDTRGNLIRLSAYRGRKNVVLILNRGFA